MIDRKSIDEVITKADIIEVISEFIEVKRQGANYVALSPFTNEKTPSFIISPAKQIFKDFSSGKGGDVITFLMEHEKITFAQSIRWLAKYYNIKIANSNEGVDDGLKNELIKINRYSCEFFKNTLLNSQEGQNAIKYLNQRNISIETIKTFELGYASNIFDALTLSAINASFDVKNLVSLGLSSQKQDRYFDKFRSRIIFPVFNLSNQVIGFGGRIINDQEAIAKYINSSESIIYSKRNTLYGINLAKQHITKHENCYLVEGYLDVLSMHQAGIQNTIASSGTALTLEQIKLIKRFTNNITILYDADSAGINASLKAIELILQQNSNPSVIQLPDSHDPNSYISTYGHDKFKEYILQNNKDFIEYFVNNIYLKTTDLAEKSNKISKLLSIIANIESPIKQNLFIEKLANLTNLEYNVLQSELARVFSLNNKQKHQGQTYEQHDGNYVENQDEVNFISANYSQEYEILRIIVLYGNEQVIINEEVKTAVNLILDLLNGINFNNEIYQQIINLIQENATDAGIDLKTLIHNENNDIRLITANILTEKYKPSPRYIQQYQVLEEKDVLLQLIENTIQQLKFKQITEKIMDIENKMEVAKTESELMQIQVYYNSLIKEKRELGKKMLRVF